MEAVQVLNKQENTYTIDDAMQVLFSKLDEGLDDFENGRVISKKKCGQSLTQFKYVYCETKLQDRIYP